jgi:GMP synthase (glutamine-hydrolysing)
MKPILIVMLGSALESLNRTRGDFHQWFAEGLGLPVEEMQVAWVEQGEALPDPDTVSGVVLSGSPSMVTHRLDWSERAAGWVREAVDDKLPLLGICYGHQLLAHALGGHIGPNAQGREIGSVEVTRCAAGSGDELWDEIPDSHFQHATHSEAVLELPARAVRLARTDLDPNHAFRVGECAWGVQFHPEFDEVIMRTYIDERAEELAAEGLEPSVLREGVRDCPWGANLLRRFARIVASSPPIQD